MSAPPNKEIIRRFFADVMSGHDPGAVGELVDDAVKIHHPALPPNASGVNIIASLLKTFRDAFPDLRYNVDDVIAEDAKVAAQWTARGTHSGVLQFPGKPPIPPTGRTVMVTGTDVFKLRNARIAEVWINSDVFGLMEQIGVI
jgi:steroid delta-isomerase-like uncharacterized protein